MLVVREAAHILRAAVGVIQRAFAVIHIVGELSFIDCAAISSVQRSLPGSSAAVHLAGVGHMTILRQNVYHSRVEFQWDSPVFISRNAPAVFHKAIGQHCGDVHQGHQSQSHHQRKRQPFADQPAEDGIVIPLVPWPDIQQPGKEFPNLDQNLGAEERGRCPHPQLDPQRHDLGSG